MTTKTAEERKELARAALAAVDALPPADRLGLFEWFCHRCGAHHDVLEMGTGFKLHECKE